MIRSKSRKLLFSAVVLLAFLALLAGTARAENRGVRIDLGDRVDSAIDPDDDTDEFIFDGLARTVLTVAVGAKKGSALIPDLELLDPRGGALDITAFFTASNTSR